MTDKNVETNTNETQTEQLMRKYEKVLAEREARIIEQFEDMDDDVLAEMLEDCLTDVGCLDASDITSDAECALADATEIVHELARRNKDKDGLAYALEYGLEAAYKAGYQ